MNADGSNVRQLTSSGHEDTQPRVSPDGRMVVFTREPAGGGDSEIFVIWENLAACNSAGPCSGGSAFPDETNLTNEPGQDDQNPDWTPDGERIVYDTRISPTDRDLHWLTYTEHLGLPSRWFEGTTTSPLPPASDTLRQSVNDTTTSIPVVGQRLPTEMPYVAQIEAERVQVTGGGFGTTLTVVRGFDGTTATSHVIGTPIMPVEQPAHDESQPVWSSDGLTLAFTLGSLDGTRTDVAIAGVETRLFYDASTRGRTDDLVVFPPNIAASGAANPPGQGTPSTRIGSAATTSWCSRRTGTARTRSIPTTSARKTTSASRMTLRDDRFPSVDETSGRILFRSDRVGGVDRMLRMDVDGGNVTQVPDSPAAQPGSDPAWYPRDPQSRILFVRDNTLATGLYDIWTMNPDGSDAVQVTQNGISNADSTWSPDASRIAHSGYRDDPGPPGVYVMDADGSNVIALTDDLVLNGDLPCTSACYAGSPTWSPDGKRIAFVYTEDFTTYGIWTVASDGSGDLQLVTQEPVGIGGIAWSPDGTRIAYGLTSGPCCDEDHHIWTIHPDGSGNTQITTGATDDGVRPGRPTARHWPSRGRGRETPVAAS